MMNKDEERPEGYISPLDLIQMIFWGIPHEAEDEVETMTTTEVMVHLKVSRSQLAKWSDTGELKPILLDKYDADVVHKFVPPAAQEGNEV